jgi:hypothetical protein
MRRGIHAFPCSLACGYYSRDTFVAFTSVTASIVSSTRDTFGAFAHSETFLFKP